MPTLSAGPRMPSRVFRCRRSDRVEAGGSIGSPAPRRRRRCRHRRVRAPPATSRALLELTRMRGPSRARNVSDAVSAGCWCSRRLVLALGVPAGLQLLDEPSNLVCSACIVPALAFSNARSGYSTSHPSPTENAGSPSASRSSATSRCPWHRLEPREALPRVVELQQPWRRRPMARGPRPRRKP